MANQKVKRVSEFAQVAEEGLRRSGMTLYELRDAVGVSYEYARKVIRGELYASNRIAKAIAEVLHLPVKEMVGLATKDRLGAKNSAALEILSGKNPEMQPIEANWKFLNPDDKAELISLVQMKAKRNQRGGGRSARQA